ncbi:hypothetical protein Ari01nite_71590 [Paractinoplanes rishiriensis]|uniref:non-specific serine/threonine protein kinase n=1 Tax=Paractinoplanes rishiriensis TaxID=1050105 RepID=A0A919K6P6_9ACTN|nr:protein kinase [Actinoplanes rishiriensis]GIE99694.1 hypothetical protein Ari01nite_71590 [Actinoplanes rishiriensis]
MAAAVSGSEAEGLEHLRAHLPDAPPYHVWSNVTFRSKLGGCHEVDAIVLCPAGLYLVELKGYEDVSGGLDVWRLAHMARPLPHPFVAANRKAPLFKARLEKAAGRHSRDVPFVQAAVFLHHPGMINRLDPGGRINVYGREDDPKSGLPGIVSGLLSRPPGNPRHQIDQRISDWLAGLIDRMGFEPRQLDVGPVRLDDLEPYAEGPGWQDYVGHDHMSAKLRRRVRVFRASRGASAEERETISRAARREIHLMEGIAHPGIAKPLVSVEQAPDTALVYDHHDDQEQLEAHLVERGADLDLSHRLRLVGQLGQALRTAHSHGLFHRALSPSSVFVRRPARPQAVITGWQTGGRESMTAVGTPSLLAGTQHVDHLIAAPDAAYHAPEATNPMSSGPAADVFSLGALAFRIITGRPPAASHEELRAELAAAGGLDIGDLPGPGGAALRSLVLEATRGEVGSRLRDVAQFLDRLAEAERLLDPSGPAHVDPLDCDRGAELDGLFRVERRLGKGTTAQALLVSRIDEPSAEPVVLKVALDHEKASLLEAEERALVRIDDERIVKTRPGPPYVGGRRTLILEYCGEETLLERLRQDRLHVDQVRRFGDDLLGIVAHLEQTGVRHRDIKPENLGVRKHDADGKPHLVLYDFSLARVADRDTVSGTTPYLDPFLGPPDRPVFDDHAERFAAAVTLYEIATGVKPRWGDGSDPRVTAAEVTVESALLDAAVRDRMTEFFRVALARRADRRHPGVAAMARAWRDAFLPPVPKQHAPAKQPAPAPAPQPAPMPAPTKQPAPAKTAPAKTAPAKAASVNAAPVKAAPVKDAPAKAAPVNAAPAKAAPVNAAPAKAAPVNAAPVKDAPAKAASAKTAPAKAAPVKAAPVKQAVKVPVQAAPAAEAGGMPVLTAAEVQKLRLAVLQATLQRDRLTKKALVLTVHQALPRLTGSGWSEGGGFAAFVTRYLGNFRFDPAAGGTLRAPDTSTGKPAAAPPGKPTLTAADVAKIRREFLKELKNGPLTFSKAGDIALRTVPWIKDADWGGAARLTGFLELHLRDFPQMDTPNGRALLAPPTKPAAPQPPKSPPKQATPKQPPPPPPVIPVEDVEAIRKQLIREARTRNPLPLSIARDAIHRVAPWIVESNYARRGSVTRLLEEIFAEEFACVDNSLHVPDRWTLMKNKFSRYFQP